jgi:hypothetical protein
MLVDTEDLRSNHDEAAGLAGRLCDISVELVTVGCFKLNCLTHFYLLCENTTKLYAINC